MRNLKTEFPGFLYYQIQGFPGFLSNEGRDGVSSNNSAEYEYSIDVEIPLLLRDFL